VAARTLLLPEVVVLVQLVVLLPTEPPNLAVMAALVYRAALLALAFLTQVVEVVVSMVILVLRQMAAQELGRLGVVLVALELVATHPLGTV
jgi:hypothetical protein